VTGPLDSLKVKGLLPCGPRYTEDSPERINMVLVLLRSCVAIPVVTDNNRLPWPRIIIESECYMGMQMRIPVAANCQINFDRPEVASQLTGDIEHLQPV
jgi:hypothetical protein